MQQEVWIPAGKYNYLPTSALILSNPPGSTSLQKIVIPFRVIKNCIEILRLTKITENQFRDLTKAMETYKGRVISRGVLPELVGYTTDPTITPPDKMVRFDPLSAKTPTFFGF